MNFFLGIASWILSFFLNRRKDADIELGKKSQLADDQKVAINDIKGSNDIKNKVDRLSDAVMYDELYSRWKRK